MKSIDDLNKSEQFMLILISTTLALTHGTIYANMIPKSEEEFERVYKSLVETAKEPSSIPMYQRLIPFAEAAAKYFEAEREQEGYRERIAQLKLKQTEEAQR